MRGVLAGGALAGALLASCGWLVLRGEFPQNPTLPGVVVTVPGVARTLSPGTPALEFRLPTPPPALPWWSRLLMTADRGSLAVTGATLTLACPGGGARPAPETLQVSLMTPARVGLAAQPLSGRWLPGGKLRFDARFPLRGEPGRDVLDAGWSVLLVHLPAAATCDARLRTRVALRVLR